MSELATLFDVAETEHGGLGFVEYRPTPARATGVPVGYDDRNQPVYRPLWADYRWEMTSVSAAAMESKRLRSRAVLFLLKAPYRDVEKGRRTAEMVCDDRDHLATARDLVRHHAQIVCDAEAIR